ncbi:hypothetical protein HG263_02920 [Pseudoalteromonas sp. JBTF-M23]|uniref:Uncharacterized protein n=1 Tax=Pseudoalteromonas caenipelagi TaxID=2726988 RepID=A0A849V9P9_9GAMM|nr:hypothetical protein [Pseudoalteromonas caenipelagi]NOU49500.1 hypothetical protein [Pseudoalteromonas caenipelagi]
MTIEAQLALLQKAVTEQTDASVKLATDVTDSINEIDQVKADMHGTHDLIKANHQAINDWQTKTGKVSLKDLNGQSYQVDSLSDLINDTQKINPHPDVMTKAQFDALREMRKQQYAGSGFVEWGKHNRASSNQKVNEGMWQWLSPSFKNGLIMGEVSTNIIDGASKSIYPKVVIDGTLQHVFGVAHGSTQTTLKFPSAPDGTKTYDSATGKVTQYASAVEAFTGLIKSGSFDSGEGWVLPEGWKIGNNLLSYDGTGGQYYKPVSLSNEPLVNDNEYVLEVTVSSIDSGNISVAVNNEASFTNPWGRLDIDSVGTHKIKFKAPASGEARIIVQNNNAQQKVSISSICLRPATEQVITSRKDLVFLESWHEKIADKDVVYPLGNVQFGASNYEGIGLANNLVAQGYSAFGEWDTNTKGYGVKWSTLSAANRVKFLKNPEHNIYYDPEAKAYIQVRYRVRVVEGLGDNWNNNRFLAPQTVSYFHYLGSDNAANSRIITRGQLDTNLDVSNVTSGDYVNGYVCKSPYDLFPDKDSSHWQPRNNQNRTCAYKSQCFAIPIALVQRLNQGAYHPVYNPMGTAQWGGRNSEGGDELAYRYPWSAAGTHESWGMYATSTLDAFVKRTSAPNGLGTIGNNSGRPDQYKYHDAIYAGQVEDLRLNANKLDVNQLREDTIRKAVAGTLRGKNKLVFTNVKAKKLAIANTYAGKYYINLFGTVDQQNGYEIEPECRKFSYLYNSTRGTLLYAAYVEPSGNIYTSDKHGTLLDNSFQKITSSTLLDWQVGDDIYVIKGVPLSSEFDSLPWTDIIGHPERIAATFPDGVIGQWLPKLPDNSSGYPLNRKMADGVLNASYTRDLGQTWTNSNVGFDQIKNTSSGSWNPDIVALLSYKTPAQFTEASSQLGILGDVSNIYVTQANQTAYGNRLQPSLIGKVGTRSNGALIHEEVAVNKLSRYAPTGQLTWTQSLGDEPKHAPLNLDSQTEPSSAVKTLSTVIEKNGLLYLQFNGAELMYSTPEFTQIRDTNLGANMIAGTLYYVHPDAGTTAMDGRYWYCKTSSNVNWNASNWVILANGTVGVHHAPDRLEYLIPIDPASWGDDQTIPIINGENTKTDLNGNTVKVFCHHTQLPLGIASH